MGRPRVKIIDDSQLEEEKTSTRPSSGGRKTYKQARTAKSEVDEASGEVERTSETDDSSEEQDAKQAPSEHTGDASDALQPDEPTNEIADQSQKPSEPAPQKKPQKPGKAKPRSKKYQEKVKDLDRTKLYPLEEAVDMAKKMSYSKINATLEAHINTTQTGIRGLVSLPYAKGVQLRILCFGPSNPQIEGVVFGSDEAIEAMNKEKVDFDLIITTPDWMPKLAKVARILGPRGLMPNPKNGTIVAPSADGLKKAVESFQAGKTEYKTEPKAPVIHIVMGKLDQPTEELSANIKTLLQALGKTRVRKLTLSPTMGPGVKVDLTSI